jgi:hypothetical protein
MPIRALDDVSDSMELTTLIRVWLRRLPLIALLGLLCGATAWVIAGGQEKVYEQKLSFVLRPATRLPVEEADRVAGTLAERDSAITQTMLGVVQSVPVDGGSSAAGIDREITLRPGSNIIDVVLEGDAAALTAAGQSYSASVTQRVRRSYRMYELEQLGGTAGPTQKPSTLWRTIALAVLLGCALAMGVAALEYRALRRSSADVSGGEADAVFPAMFEEEPTPARTGRAER